MKEKTPRLYVIVVRKNTNKMLPTWKPGMRVRRAESKFLGDQTFDLDPGPIVEAYVSYETAQAWIDVLRDRFTDIDFKVIEYERKVKK